jgi:hypothetical protein
MSSQFLSAVRRGGGGLKEIRTVGGTELEGYDIKTNLTERE